MAFLRELCTWVNPQRTSSPVSSECSTAHPHYFNPLHSLFFFLSITECSWSFFSFLTMCVFFLADRSFLESPYCPYSLFRAWGIWSRESLFTHLQSYFSKLLDLYVVLASWLLHQEVLKWGHVVGFIVSQPCALSTALDLKIPSPDTHLVLYHWALAK